MEAALIVGILIAFITNRGDHKALKYLWWGVGLAVTLSLTVGAIFTFGASTVPFKAQEVLGGSLSILAVVLVTWMVFWMASAGKTMKQELEQSASHRLSFGGPMAMFWLAFISVGREGLETTLMLWGWAMQPITLLGALCGVGLAVILGYFVFKGLLRINYTKFFLWTGVFLIIVAAGILAYGIHDLQETAILPGPFSGSPITPTDFRTGEVMTGFFTPIPYWGAAYPFGWAFDYSNVISPDGALASFLKGTIGLTPQMSWLEITVWFIYLVVVLPRFINKMRVPRAVKEAQKAKANAKAQTETPVETATEPRPGDDTETVTENSEPRPGKENPTGEDESNPVGAGETKAISQK